MFQILNKFFSDLKLSLYKPWTGSVQGI
jgi:hypothetical protein